MQSSEGSRLGVFPYLPDVLLELDNPVVAVSVLGRLMDLLDSWLSWVTMVFMLVPWDRECLCTGSVELLVTMLSLVTSFWVIMSMSTFPFSTVNTEVGRIFFFNLFFFFIFMMINMNTANITTQVMTAVEATIQVNVFRSSFCTVCLKMTVCRYCGQFA